MSPASALDSSQFYVTGGTLDPDSASYIERRADSELVDALRGGELCYVLASRQMGKSSLMARTARRLTAEGFTCAIVDLTIFSEKDGPAGDWYYALVDHIADKLGFDFDVGAWWQQNHALPPLGRLTAFLDRVVLSLRSRHVVIFVDEIDATIRLPFSDDFFAAIRACYNARATKPRFKRLNLVLIGVATPVQLIRDPTRTPFNIGRGVQLTDFTSAEAAPLASGLHSDPERAKELLERVLYWTDGHPYLTQSLCRQVAQFQTWEVDEIVKDIFLSRGAKGDEPNLRFVRERLTQGEADLSLALNLYREIVAGRPVRDEPNSPVHASLRLSGVVKTDLAGKLRVRNRIYRTVFSEEWVTSEMPSESATVFGAPAAVAEAYSTYDVLRKLPEFRPLACGVLARKFESQCLRDEALLVYFHSLQEEDAQITRCHAANLIQFDYPDLLLSFVHKDAITNAAMSPKGTSVLIGSRDGLARLWSTSSGQTLLQPLHHRGPVNSVAFSPDGEWFATGSDDHNAYIWNAKNGIKSAPLQHQARVRFVTFSPKSTKLVSCSADGTARVWHVETGQPVCGPLLHNDSVHIAAFSPDETLLLTASQNKMAILWQLSSAGLESTPLPHDAIVNVVAFHPSGSAFVTGSDDGKVTAWDCGSKAILWAVVLSGSVQDIAISLDGQSFVCATADCKAIACRWAAPSSPYATLLHHDRVVAVAFTPDGKAILTGSADKTMRVWSAADGSPLRLPFRHQGRVTAVSATPDSTKVLTTDEKGTVRLWRLEGGPRQIGPLIYHAARINCAAYRPDGAIVATCCEDGVVRFWTPSGEPAADPLSHSSAVSSVAYAPANNLLAVGCEDGTISLWDPATARRIGTQFSHDNAVSVLQFSPDGRRLASGSDDKTARVWDITTGILDICLQHRDSVRGLMFSWDGTQLLTGGADRSARLWSISDGSQFGSVLDLPAAVSAVAFRPGNQEHFLSCGGTTLLIWRLKKDEQETRLRDVPTLVTEKVYRLQFVDSIEHAAFTPQGDHLLVFTRSWAYYYAVQKSGLIHISSHLLLGPWAGAIHWHEPPSSLELCLLDAGNSLAMQTLLLDTRSTATVAADPEQLLSEWQWRLGQLIRADCRVVPAYSTPE